MCYYRAIIQVDHLLPGSFETWSLCKVHCLQFNESMDILTIIVGMSVNHAISDACFVEVGIQNAVFFRQSISPRLFHLTNSQ